MFAFGPGHVNGVHNHLLSKDSPRRVFAAAGWRVTYEGPTTWQLTIDDYVPTCARCPQHLPAGRMHIPALEIHATRPLGVPGTSLR